MGEEFTYRDIQLLKSVSLGSGSYGGVCKARCDGLLCAAKIMHPTLFDPRDPGRTTYLSKFLEECRLLSLARHPNVVQYLGTYTDPDTRLPVLLMELCDESLTAFLERSPGPLSYHTQVNMAHDIALALVYLHSNGLIHRDLTGNNVLIIAGPRAKITDFGMSKLASVNPRMSALTKCPGNMLYMSPEALDDGKSYTTKLDIFSFGVIVIQICTRQFPDPTGRFRIVNTRQTHRGEEEEKDIREVIPETERRQAHLKLITDAHPLKPLVLECLKKKESLRPSAVELTERISGLMDSSDFTESLLRAQGDSDIDRLEKQLKYQVFLTEAKANEAEQHQARITELESVVSDKDRELQAKNREMLRYQHTIDSQKQLLEDYEPSTQARERSIQAINIQLQELKRGFEAQAQELEANSVEMQVQELTIDAKERQLQECLDTIESHRQGLQAKDTELQRLQLTLSRQRGASEQEQQDVRQLRAEGEDEAQVRKQMELMEIQEQLRNAEHLLSEFQLSLEQKDSTIAALERMIQELEEPDTLSLVQLPLQHTTTPEVASKSISKKGVNAPEQMSRGAAVVYGHQACFMPVGSHKVFSYRHQNQQWSQLPDNPNPDCGLAVVNGALTSVGGCTTQPTNALLSLMENGRWVDIFPPMPTPRCLAACVIAKSRLVVAGGDQDRCAGGLETVEVMDTETKEWSTASPLPRKCSALSAAVVGDTLYLAGGYRSENSVFTCSVSDFQPKMKQSVIWRMFSQTQRKEIKGLPVLFSTLATIGDDLLAIGGKDDSENPTANVYKYDFHSKVWKVLGQMTNTRLLCLAVSLPGEDCVMVVGGFVDRDYVITENSVELLQIKNEEQ